MPFKAKEKGRAVGSFGLLMQEFRKRLGISRDRLARAIGVSAPAVYRWEAGERTPEKITVLRMLELCGDDAVRREFAVKFEAARRAEVGGDDRALDAKEEGVLKNYSDAATGINILYEMALAGNAGAAEELSRLTETINRRAGDWRRMKYLKKPR